MAGGKGWAPADFGVEVCSCVGLSVSQSRRLEGSWKWKLDFAQGYNVASHVAVPCHLLSSPHQLLSEKEVGKCEEQHTAGSRWSCAC